MNAAEHLQRAKQLLATSDDGPEHDFGSPEASSRPAETTAALVHAVVALAEILDNVGNGIADAIGLVAVSVGDASMDVTGARTDHSQ